MSSDDAPLNGEIGVRTVMHGSDLDWSASPSGTVWRKRFHRVGPAEAGQVTSMVRYEPGSSFPVHDHPDGEEILVLDGVFSDEHGDWPAGTYLLNPEGFRHAPFSKPGCLLWVKLRQYSGSGRRHVAIDTNEMPWQPIDHGAHRKTLYDDPGFEDRVTLERWPTGYSPDVVDYSDGAELFVIDGGFEDEYGHYQAGSWLRLPADSRHAPHSKTGCTLYIKRGGLSQLLAG